MAIDRLTSQQARNRLLELEKQHGRRRQLVWAQLGEAPRALALEHLAVLAETTQSALAAGSLEDIADAYRNAGWHADDAQIRALAAVDKPAVIIAISDTGCGISEDNLSKNFNPFFTTKAIGLGTGLGLHLCRSIVDKHQGRITVESRWGQGTTFSIILPVDPSSDNGQTSCIDLAT